MNPGATILTEIEDYIERENLTISKFAERSGLHSGTLSNIVNGNRPIAMQQLDKITQAMEMSEGYFYDLYIDCYIINGAADWRRIGPLLLRCADLNKLEAIHRVVGNILDNLFYLPMLFDTAEELFTQQKHAAAEIIYKSVAEGERFQHSERLALCQYRLFHIALGDDQEANLQAAIQFESYVERLDEADQLDAIKELIYTYSSLKRWSKVKSLAETLGKKADSQYQYFINDNKKEKQPTRPLIYYVLYSNLSKSVACSESEDYTGALYYTSLISDFNLIKSHQSEEEHRVIIQFQEWNTANTYLYRLMSGNVEVLPDYICYIEQHKNEIPTALMNITQAANKFSLDIDDTLEKFKDYITYTEQHSRLGKFNIQVINSNYLSLLINLTIYYFSKARSNSAFRCLLESLELSIKLNSDSNIVKCVTLFEEYRDLATLPQTTAYKDLIFLLTRRILTFQ